MKKIFLSTLCLMAASSSLVYAKQPTPFIPLAVRQVDIYPLATRDAKLRVIETNTAVSLELGQFNTYPMYVFELIQTPKQRLIKQIRIQKAIKLSDGKILPINEDGIMGVVPDRHEFDGETLRVWINYFPLHPPGLLVECRYKVSSKDIQPLGCDASAVE